MSLASCSFQCGWISTNTTYSISILAKEGDLFQRYTGSYANPSEIVPDWSSIAPANRPVIAIIAMESDPDVQPEDIRQNIIDQDTNWYIDDLQLTFNTSTGLCTSAPYTGLLRRLTAADGANHRADAPYGGLEICGNLITATAGHTVTVKAIVAMDTGGTGSRYQGTTPIRMIKSNGQSNFCSIYCDTGDSFILDHTNPSVTCKVKCWQGASIVTPATVKWYLVEAGQWVLKATSATFQVTQDMIQTFGDVKAECYDATGTIIASDIQTINDAEDPYILYPCPAPADALFYQTGGPDKVTFTPEVYHNDGTQVTGLGYYFIVMDSAGNPQNPLADRTTLKTSYDVLADWARAIGEGPTVNITAVKTS